MNFFRRRFNYIMHDVDTVFLPLFLGLCSMAWGTMLLIGINTFDTAISYEIMQQFGNETKWGIFMVVVGASQFLTAFIDLPWKWQAASNFLSIVKWLAISLALYLSNPVSAIGVAYPFFVLMAYVRFYRAIKDRKRL